MTANNAIVKYLVQVAISGIMILWAIRNLYPIEPMEYRLVEQGVFGWLTVPVFTRLFISLQFITAALLLLSINPGKVTTKLCLLILTLGLADILWEIISSSPIILHCYGCISDLTWLSMVVWTLAVAMSVFLLRFDSSDFRFKWVKYPVILVLLPLSFILNPVYPQDFQDRQPILNKPLQAEFVPDSLKSESFLLAVFSPGCTYCQRVARKISVAKNRSELFPASLPVFTGESKHAEYFMNVSNTNMDYVIIDAKKFIELSERRFPTILLVENDTIKKRWNGRTFNYGVMRNLSQTVP